MLGRRELGKVDVGNGELAVAIGHEAVETDDENFVATVHDMNDVADLRLEDFFLLPIGHDKRLVEAELPDAMTGVLSQGATVGVVFIGIVALGGGEIPVFSEEEHPIACCSNSDSAITESPYLADPWLHASREVIMPKGVGGGIVIIESAVCSHP